ncbi:reactive intermediate/imine deaminase [candidate division KSB1 bacterium]|nr:reactive intermediate/imine deaminase [candidate division KSB1 bacterium]RQW02169.1 MAG: reactive intermediate/imine deaminase [candidate division KSB1 bacterium]
MKKIISTSAAPTPLNNLYSQGVLAQGKFLFTAGQLGVDPKSGELADGLRAQTQQALENIRAVLKAAGTDISYVVKVTVLLDNLGDFAAMNEVYATFFPESPPARTAFEAARLPIGALVEIEAIAIVE